MATTHASFLLQVKKGTGADSGKIFAMKVSFIEGTRVDESNRGW